MENEIGFDEWFDLFKEKVRQLGYDGPIDRESFKDEYSDGREYEDSALEFYNEMIS